MGLERDGHFDYRLVVPLYIRIGYRSDTIDDVLLCLVQLRCSPSDEVGFRRNLRS